MQYNADLFCFETCLHTRIFDLKHLDFSCWPKFHFSPSSKLTWAFWPALINKIWSSNLNHLIVSFVKRKRQKILHIRALMNLLMNFVNYVRTLEVSSNFSMFFVLERLWESWNKQFSKLNKTNFEQARLSDRKKRNHKTRNKSSSLRLTPKTVLQPIFTRIIENSDNFMIVSKFSHSKKFLDSLDFSALNARLLSTNLVNKTSFTWTRFFATRADSF